MFKSFKVVAVSALLGFQLAASATNYALPISAAIDMQFANRTLAEDQIAEFESASKLLSIYVRYVGYGAIAKAIKDDYLYVTYKDGQIAKFKVINPTGTIKVRYEGTVPSVPSDAQRPNLNFTTSEIFRRSDYAVSENVMMFFQERILTPTVTVTQEPAPQASILETLTYTYSSGGGGTCGQLGSSCNPILLRVGPSKLD